MRVACLLLYLGYAVFVVWQCISYHSYNWLIAAVPPIAAFLGLVLRQKWALYAAAANSIIAIGVWVYSFVFFSLRSPSWPYPGLLANIISLAPGAIWLLVWICAPIVIYQIYRRPSVADAF